MIREKISLSIHEMTVVAMMIAIIAILGAVPGIPLGFIPVPIILQNMGIMIAGELLGPRLGTIAVWLFLFLVYSSGKQKIEKPCCKVDPIDSL